MKFRYEGYNGAAKKVSGEIEAANAADARQSLRNMGVRPSKFVVINGGASSQGPKAPGFDLNALLASFDSGAPNLVEFAAFIRQMAVMQAAGIPIVQSLGIMADAAETKGFGRALLEIRSKVEGGMNFAEALRLYPQIFDRIFVNLVAAGEVSGSMDRMLERLAVYYEKSSALRRKVVSALVYPSFMIVLMVVVVTVMLMFVVPTFAEMFSSQGKALPEATQFILDVSNTVREFWWAYLGSVGTLVGAIYYSFKSDEIRTRIDPFLIRLPFLGPMIMKISIARFSRTFGTMIQSGVPILDALDITSQVAGNSAVEAALRKTKESISQGSTISAPLMEAGVFPKMAVSMIGIGEQTGAIDSMLNKIADFYEDEVDAKISGLTSVLEPLMILLVGGVIAGILIPMYLPVFKMGEVMGGG